MLSIIIRERSIRHFLLLSFYVYPYSSVKFLDNIHIYGIKIHMGKSILSGVRFLISKEKFIFSRSRNIEIKNIRRYE